MAQNSDREKYPILIVDDEPYVVEALVDCLDEYKVDYAYDAEAALQKLASGKFKVVLTDILMPGLDGIELLRQIKNVNPSIQVIMMTGQTTSMRAMESMQNGAVRYLMKPFTGIREVNDAINEAIGKLKGWEEIYQKTIRGKKAHVNDAQNPIRL